MPKPWEEVSSFQTSKSVALHITGKRKSLSPEKKYLLSKEHCTRGQKKARDSSGPGPPLPKPRRRGSEPADLSQTHLGPERHEIVDQVAWPQSDVLRPSHPTSY